LAWAFPVAKSFQSHEQNELRELPGKGGDLRRHHAAFDHAADAPGESGGRIDLLILENSDRRRVSIAHC